jgi:hypothetical protein
VVPWIGAAISGDRQAYRYLDESIEGFHQSEAFSSLMRQAGFREVSVIPLTWGVASIYKGTKQTVGWAVPTNSGIRDMVAWWAQPTLRIGEI